MKLPDDWAVSCEERGLGLEYLDTTVPPRLLPSRVGFDVLFRSRNCVLPVILQQSVEIPEAYPGTEDTAIQSMNPCANGLAGGLPCK